MALFDKISETINTKGKDVAGKAKNLADLAGYNVKIVTQQDMINKYFKEIGRYMYEHKDTEVDNGLEERYKLVDDAYAEIDRLKAEIRKIKGVKQCTNCEAEVDAEHMFCPKCGTIMPQDVPEEVHAEEVRDVTEGCCEEGCDCCAEAEGSCACDDEAKEGCDCCADTKETCDAE